MDVKTLVSIPNKECVLHTNSKKRNETQDKLLLMAVDKSPDTWDEYIFLLLLNTEVDYMSLEKMVL